MVVFVALALALLPTFFHFAPYLADAVFRARGSEALEFSVRITRDRNMFAYVLLIPAVLIMSRYRLYDPSFMQQISAMGEGWYLLACVGVLAAYLLVRLIIYLILKPRRRFEYFRLAHRAIYTFFILLMLIARRDNQERNVCPSGCGVFRFYHSKSANFVINLRWIRTFFVPLRA